MLCICTRSTTHLFALANDTRIVRSRDAQGYCIAQHCASLLPPIFSSLVCAIERVHVHSQKIFQTKLDSEINARFLLNKHGDLHFYRIVIVCKTVIWNANYDRENNDYTNSLRPRRFNWCDFPQSLYDIFPYKLHFLTVKGFPKYYFNKLCFQLPQSVTWSDENLSGLFDAGFLKIILVTITNFAFDFCLLIKHEIFNISFAYFVTAA